MSDIGGSALFNETRGLGGGGTKLRKALINLNSGSRRELPLL
ncbi:hypothetical protein [Roseixanthobacter pseudopolyaromaticivorans]